MPTYKQIQEWVKNKNEYGFTVKTCWIAHVKEQYGLIPINPTRKHPCPEKKKKSIEDAFKHFKVSAKCD